MCDSAAKKCNEWPLLDGETVRVIMGSFPLWDLVEDQKCFKISRKFTTTNFVTALNFIAKAGEVAEARGHHPDLHLTSYRDVEVIIFTHSLSGLTENDFNLAQALDAIPVAYSPKWAALNPKSAISDCETSPFKHIDYKGQLHDERVLP